MAIAAIEAYQQEVKSGKCALFYINGCDVPLCAYKSEDNKKEILLAYNKKKSDVEFDKMGKKLEPAAVIRNYK